MVQYFEEEIQSDLEFILDENSIIAKMCEPCECSYSSQVTNVEEFINRSKEFNLSDIEIDGDYEGSFEITIDTSEDEL